MPRRDVRWLERAVAGAFAVWAAGRVAAADRWRPVDVQAVALLSFTPQAAGAACLTALLARDRVAANITAASAGVLAAVVAPRAIGRSQPGADGPALRVLTANLLVGRATAEPVVELARRLDVDVLFVQEVTGAAAGRLARAGLGDVLPHHVSDLGRAGSRGNAIYARYPLADCTSMLPESAARPVAMISLPGGRARLGCVHLRAPKPVRGRSGVPTWRSELRTLPAAGQVEVPLVLAGDFNATLDHAEFRRLLARGYADAASQAGMGLAPTWGPGAGRRGQLTIDHVLADRRCAVLGASVHALPGTDHRAVFARLVLPRA